MSSKSHIYFTFKGQTILSFWIDRTSGKGISMGPVIDGSDLHLTVFGREGKLRYHIKHRGIEEPADESPVGRQTSARLVAGRIQRLLRRRLGRYHGNKTCWVLPPERLRKIQSFLPAVGETNDVYVPLEVAFSELDMDCTRKEGWKKVRIKDLLGKEPRFGFLESRGGRKHVIIPISQNQLIAWPLSKSEKFFEYLAEVGGVKEFLDYLVQTDEGKRLLAEAKKKVKELAKK